MIVKVVSSLTVNAAHMLVIPDAVSRGRRRAALHIYCDYSVGGICSLELTQSNITGQYIGALTPGDTFNDKENPHGEIYQGPYYASVVTGAPVLQITEDLYA